MLNLSRLPQVKVAEGGHLTRAAFEKSLKVIGDRHSSSEPTVAVLNGRVLDDLKKFGIRQTIRDEVRELLIEESK